MNSYMINVYVVQYTRRLLQAQYAYHLHNRHHELFSELFLIFLGDIRSRHYGRAYHGTTKKEA